MSVVNHHKRVMRLFDNVRVLTAELLDNFSVDNFTNVLSERSTLLSSIKYEMDLHSTEGYTEESFEVLSTEVDNCLRDIRAMDLKVTSVIQNKMNEIRDELKGLSKSAPAALAYSFHKR